MSTIPPINPLNQLLADHIRQLKTNAIYSAFMGDTKGYISAQKDFAKIAVDHFELSTSVKGMSINNVPLFSKHGFNITKCLFFNKLRKKTPEEKLYMKMLKQWKKQSLKIK